MLDTPIRATWALEDAGTEPATALRIADRLVEGGLLLVTLLGKPLGHPAAAEIIERLTLGGARVEAECSGHPAEQASLERGARPAGLLLRADDFCQAGNLSDLGRTLERLRSLGVPVGLTFTPRRNALAHLPRLLAFCRDHRVARFKLPNLRADATLGPRPEEEIPRPEDLDRLALMLAEVPAFEGTKLEVHDLFLWELLCRTHAGERSEFGGCQAGRTLAHVTTAGELQPCSSWPVPLGSLLEAPLESLWENPLLEQVRGQAAARPEGCRGCRIFSSCRGGCRGLAETFSDESGARDPGCDGPR